MKKRSVPCITLVVALCTLAPAVGTNGPAISDSLPTAEQVIERYITAVGGREAIERLSTRLLIGRQTTDLEWTPPVYEVIPIAFYSRVPNSFLMVEHKADGTICEGFDGKATWVQDPDGINLNDQPRDLKLSWLLNPQNALRLSDYFPGLRVAARDYIGGTPVCVLDPVGLDRTYYSLYFDADTGLLVRIGYYTDLEDYREVDGVKFPFQVSASRQGGSTAYVFDLVVHNLTLDSSLFAVPTSAGPKER